MLNNAPFKLHLAGLIAAVSLATPAAVTAADCGSQVLCPTFLIGEIPGSAGTIQRYCYNNLPGTLPAWQGGLASGALGIEKGSTQCGTEVDQNNVTGTVTPVTGSDGSNKKCGSIEVTNIDCKEK